MTNLIGSNAIGGGGGGGGGDGAGAEDAAAAAADEPPGYTNFHVLVTDVIQSNACK